MFGAAKNLLNGVVHQRLQPQLFNLVYLGIVRVGRVVLIVIIEPEQGKDLIDCLNPGFRGGLSLGLSLPMRCR